MLTAWIIYSEAESIRNQQYIKFYMEESLKLDISMKLILAEKLSFGIKNNCCYASYEGVTTTLPDFAICRMMYPLLTKQLEYMGVRTFNNSHVSEICNDKAKTYQYIAKLGISVIDTEFVKKEFALDKIRSADYPIIFKTVDGHGGTQVFLVHNKEEAEECFAQVEGSDIVIQPFIDSCCQDLRVYVLGRQVIAAILRTAKDGFKANYSLGGEVSAYDLSFEELELIDKITEQFDFGLAGIDFILEKEADGRKSLIFNEIEDVVGSRMLYQCTNINIVKLYLEYIRAVFAD